MNLICPSVFLTLTSFSFYWSEVPLPVSQTFKNAETTPVISPTPPVNPPDQSWNTVRNEVNGIGIADTKNQVIDRFGKPLSVKKGGTNGCGGPKTVLRYPGISFTLDEDEAKNDIVVLIDITSPKWEIAPGVKINERVEDVQARMGRAGNLLKGRAQDVLTYGDGDGWIEFYFQKGRLVRIVRNLNLC